MNLVKEWNYRAGIGQQIDLGKNEMDKAVAGLTKLLMPTAQYSEVPAFKDLRDAYIHFTGDPDVSGAFYPQKVSAGLRACQDFSTSSFPLALGNALNRVLTSEYKGIPLREDVLISQRNSVRDFRKISSVSIGYFNDIEEVDPDTGDYQDFAPSTDDRTQYALRHTGVITWVTRKMIINDDIGLISRIMKRVARAARRTHARYVWSFFYNNAPCPDGIPWFHEDHGNLSTPPFTISSVANIISSIAFMKEPGPSQEYLGIDLESFKWNLVVPMQSFSIALGMNQAPYDPSSSNLDSIYHLFGMRNQRIITPPFTGSLQFRWAIIRDKDEVPIIEMSYLNGKVEPEFILSDGPTDERVFISDKLGYKIRHEYGGVLLDYRNAYLSWDQLD